MFNFKKKYGQNFLNNPSVINKIITAVDLNKQDVIEIGPGAGVLTKALLNSGANVIAYEIDKELAPILEQNLKDFTNKKIIFNDFLKEDLKLNNETYLISNPPYNISGEIIYRFLTESKLSVAILMFQEELALRVLANIGDKSYSKLSVIVNYFCSKEKIANVSKSSFTPKPKVDSVVFKLTKKTTRELPIELENKFLSFLNACFHTPRKTLMNNLVLSNKYPKEQLSNISFDFSKRPGELDYNDFIKIFTQL